ncbi:putative LPS assembly protein LptD [Deminuibacter soli]|uniref:LPS-assembly protein LptD n=1 Tax=Deminuibacter soli TaxID=2291815 RepID=A0A3E1NGT8_9BACT|nr:putative LPS assembly protein LptD [Deminuibacter soli]RFM27097.1 LPS-assembly protein LptD [Deminuibacter soli]
MGILCKVSVKYVFGGVTSLLLLFIAAHAGAQVQKKQEAKKEQVNKIDSANRVNNNINQGADTTRKVKDSTVADSTVQRIDSTKISRDSLDAPVEYSAADSAVLMVDSRNFYLYNKASTKYKDIKLDAHTIEYDQANQQVKAFGGVDTSKNPLNKPQMTQGDATSIMDSIRFNLKTMRGLTQNVYYKQGEMFVNAEKMKKVDDGVEYAYRTLFTTCNYDIPHFGIRARKVKIINNKLAVSGPAFPEFEGVPMPVAIPFGIYPMSTGRHSGLLPPQYTSSQDYGLGLEGLGYYKVVNDNWDVITRANIYTYGGWNLYVNPKYLVRYKYSGNLNISIQHTKILNSNSLSKDEFTKSNTFMVNWSHSNDSRARPGTSFSASVNAGSTRFNQNVANNPLLNYQNQLSSSIAYSKTWDQGKYNLTVSGNHSQNTSSRPDGTASPGTINVSLPTVNFTANTFYPFQKKESVGKAKWYEKTGISYNGSFLNQVTFIDSAVSIRKILDTLQWGAQHNIPISLSLPPVGPLIFSPSLSYSERWYAQKYQYNQVGDVKGVDTIQRKLEKGFFTAREVTVGMSMNTRIFGTYQFGKNSNIVAIRHEVKPFIGFSYKPDLMKQYYTKIKIDTLGHTQMVSAFDGSLLGSFGSGQSGSLNFGIDNLLEMKVKNRKDSTGETPTKKVRLIDGFGVTSGYNFLADSLKLQPFLFNFRSTLFEKINITANATVDPYDIDSVGQKIDRLLLKRGSLGRFTGGNIAISSSFRGGANDKRKDGDRIPEDQYMTPDEQQRQLDYVRSNPAEFVDFNIPWNLQTSLSVSFTRLQTLNLQHFYTQVNSNINLNGDFSLTPKWKIGGSAYYDFRTSQIQSLTMFVTREMHCWQMAINITPIGIRKSFSIVLNPKSGILRDLKINRSRYFYNNSYGY